VRGTYRINFWKEYLSETTNQLYSAWDLKFSPEYGGSMFLRNFDTYLQVHRASQPRRTKSAKNVVFL
jgi:hypothetical protein